MKKNDYISTIYSKEIGEKIKGFLSINNILKLRENAISTIKRPGGQPQKIVVLPGMEYRPDKIAAYYLSDDLNSRLGNETLGWLIDITNGFFGGIKDYYLGRELLIPSTESIEELYKD